jgi:hypothetical protein
MYVSLGAMNYCRLASALSVLLLAACADPEEPGPDGDEAQIQLAVTDVAAGIRCLRFSTEQAGMRKTEQKVAVTPGNPANVMLTGLAAGAVTIVGDAFTQTCGNVTATTLPAWVSDPVMRTLQPGNNPPASFVFRPAAGINGTVDFISLHAMPSPLNIPGTTVGASRMASASIRNVGTANTGMIALALELPNPDFAITGSDCGTLVPDGSCQVQIRFTPTAVGNRGQSLRVSATPGGSIGVALNGIGLSPALLAISPTFSDFGTAPPGAQVTRSFTVSNTGQSASGPVGITVAGEDAQDFAIVQNGCSALAAGASCTVAVRFSATGGFPFGDQRTATLTATASPGGSVQAQLLGRAF